MTRRIRDTVRRVAEVYPALGEHLAGTIRIGRWCVYTAAEPRTWRVEMGP